MMTMRQRIVATRELNLRRRTREGEAFLNDVVTAILSRRSHSIQE